MVTGRTLLAAAALVVTVAGCGRYTRAEAAHARFCKANPGSVELLLDGAPDRPYRVVGIVESPSATDPGRAARNNQIAACRLGANAIVDDADRGRGLAIQYVDGAADDQGAGANVASSPGVTVIGQTWSPGNAEDGGVQIQTNGPIEIHAPSVEFRDAPPSGAARD
ncbi:MAG: hypothetical protein U0414_13390 [Polyangiaceae bacterium]